MNDSAPHLPQSIVLHQKSRLLELGYADGIVFKLPCEFLRVLSPSAEVQGHGPGQETLQTGKRDVNIVNLEPVGHYALKIVFSDGHDSGLYTWSYLWTLGQKQTDLWNAYLERLKLAGLDRDRPMPTQSGPTCASH